VKSDPNFSYTPDLIRNVDLYVDVLTSLKWRKKILRFIDIVPVKQMVLTKKGIRINSFQDLKGKVISVQPDSSYHANMMKIEKETGLKFNYYYVDETGDMPEALLIGKADVTFQDSNLCLKLLSKHKELSINMPASKVEYTGWAVRKGNEDFASILEKYILYIRKTGVFEDIWEREFKLSYREYLELIGM